MIHLLTACITLYGDSCFTEHHDRLSSYRIRASEHRVHQVSLLYLRPLLAAYCTRRYWGKRDTALILPTNSSLSVTLSQDHLRSTTTSRADASFEQSDRLWLNGKEEEIKAGGRTATCLAALRKWRKEVEDKDSSAPKVSLMATSLRVLS